MKISNETLIRTINWIRENNQTTARVVSRNKDGIKQLSSRVTVKFVGGTAGKPTY